MASMRDIKRRKESVSSTGQITKAMKLVATVKLQKAKERAERTSPYFKKLYEAVCSILKKSGNINHPLLKGTGQGKKAVVVVTSNRGLAGGYNSNVIKLIKGEEFLMKDSLIYAVGRKGMDTLSRKGYTIAKEYNECMENPLFSDAAQIGRDLLEAYENGEVREIYIAYTEFKNTVTHIPTLKKLLPVEVDVNDATEEDTLTPMNFEPEADETIDIIIPKYINSIIYGALVAAVASENGARMQAMDSATSNAEDMISDLELKYNRARQGAITQELTEIIAGANAIN